MPSAYELMLVLRGRNYLSNDLRRAGSDIRRLQSQGGLENQRRQLQINAQRLASTRAIAQAELNSITTGQRRLALNKAIAENEAAQEGRLVRIRQLEERIEQTEVSRLRNAAQLSRLQRRVTSGRPMRGFSVDETKQLRDAAALENQRLMAQSATVQRQLELARQSYQRGALTVQELASREAQLSARQQILTDRINTTTAALERNNVLLRENALAMKRLPLEQLGARATYVEHLGRSFQTMGLFATAALGVAAYQASKFNTELTLASTQATIVGNRTARTVIANTAQIQRAVQQMLNSGQAAARPNELNQGLYSIYSGITLQGNQRQQIQEGIDILKQFQRVYVANYGQVQFNDVVRGGIALINSFGLSAKSLPSVLNRMQASVRFGSMTMSEFVASLNQVVPAYKSAHLSFDNLAGDVATVSRLFPNLRFGTTGLARLLEQLGKTSTIKGIQEQLGINIAPQGRLLPLLQIIQMIAQARPSLQQGGVAAQNFFKQVSGTTGTIQARRVFAQLISDIKLYRTVSSQVKGDNQELTKSFADMSQTPQVRWAEFTNQLRGLVLEIGTHALPIFTEMAGPIKDAVHWFDNLDPATQRMIVRLTVWGSVITLVGGTLLVFIGALARAYTSIRLMMIGRGGVAAAEGGFLRAGLALRVGLLGALIVAAPFILKFMGGTGGLVQNMDLLIQAFAAFKTAQMVSRLLAAQLGAMALASELALLTAAPFIITIEVIGLEMVARKIKALQQMEIAAASRTLDKKSLNREVSAFLPEFEAEKMAGKSGAALYKEWRKRLGTSDIASQVLTSLFQATGVDMPKRIAESQARGMGARRNFNPADVPKPNVGGGAGNVFNAAAAIANVENLRRVSEQKKTYASYLAYEKALTDLQKHYQGDQLTALNDYLNSVESAENKSNKKRETAEQKAAKKRATDAKNAMENARKEVTQAAQTLQSQYQSIYQNNQSAFGQLFSGPFINSPRMQNEMQWGHKLTGRDLLTDIRSQVAQFKQWRQLLGQLRKRGIGGALYDQIVAAGPGAMGEIRALLQLNPAELRSYAKTFARGQSMIAEATQQDMSLSLARYRKYGRNIALQIIQGLRDEHTPVLKVFENMILKDFPGLAKAAGHRGTGTTKGSLRNTDAPPAATDHSGRPTKPKKPQITRTTTSARTMDGVVFSPVINVANVDPHADVQTQLKHGLFHFRNRMDFWRT